MSFWLSLARNGTRLLEFLGSVRFARRFGLRRPEYDDLKLRSWMPLFAEAEPEEPLFEQALRKFFDGERDPLTIQLLR